MSIQDNNTTTQVRKDKGFYAKRIAKIAIFIAISFILSKLEFPIFPVTPYLKLDFSNVFVLIGGFLLGPIDGIIILIIKEAFCLIGTQTPVGQLANIIVGLAFILLPTWVYKYHKGIKVVIITLSISIIIAIFYSLITNRFILFPAYMGDSAQSVFNEFFWYIVAFNAIKYISISIITILLYKRIGKILRF